MNERKASDSKSRLTSYVFHEVRVPLNTAREFNRWPLSCPTCLVVPNLCYLVLAVQNLEATGTIRKAQELEWVALGGSLSMMSKGDPLHFPASPPWLYYPII